MAKKSRRGGIKKSADLVTDSRVLEFLQELALRLVEGHVGGFFLVAICKGGDHSIACAAAEESLHEDLVRHINEKLAEVKRPLETLQ